MDTQIKDLDIVALLDRSPSEGLDRGEVGTVVFDFGDGIYLVEFSDRLGQTYKVIELRSNQLLALHHIERERIAA